MQTIKRDFTQVVTAMVLKKSYEKVIKTLGAAAPKKVFNPYAKKLDKWMTMNQSKNHMIAAHELYVQANHNTYVLELAHATIYHLRQQNPQ
ncbi:hypothetical protein [Roseivirga seohaensis]|uniref:hypothetical protein n=1 Tax=Roseivirga seohaensis TaxID=1914963 RepID=UPI003BAB4D28